MPLANHDVKGDTGLQLDFLEQRPEHAWIQQFHKAIGEALYETAADSAQEADALRMKP